jgi:hypothetical protein
LYEKPSRYAHNHTNHKPALTELAFSNMEKLTYRDSKLTSLKNIYLLITLEPKGLLPPSKVIDSYFYYVERDSKRDHD